MRLARFRAAGADRAGFVEEAELVEADAAWPELLRMALTDRAAIRAVASGRRWAMNECELLVPVGDSTPGIFCIGFNYRAHAEEVGDELGDTRAGRPPIFFKLRDSLTPAGNAITLDPAFSKEMDWEVELGVVLGKGGRNIAPSEVADHIVGYTVVVDTTARDLQRDHGQWFIGKNASASSPVGPWITTVDELGFPPAIDLRLYINGVEKQYGSSDKMIWSIAEFISITSQGIELRVGDVFATGSPPGVGFTRQPPEFLSSGDLLRAEIDGVGVLEHALN